MDNLLGNPYVTGILALLGITGVWQLVKFAYNKVNPATYIRKILVPLTNMGALKIYAQLAKINDEELRNQIAKDLDETGNLIDDAWDEGLQGKKYKLSK